MSIYILTLVRQTIELAQLVEPPILLCSISSQRGHRQFVQLKGLNSIPSHWKNLLSWVTKVGKITLKYNKEERVNKHNNYSTMLYLIDLRWNNEQPVLWCLVWRQLLPWRQRHDQPVVTLLVCETLLEDFQYLLPRSTKPVRRLVCLLKTNPLFILI